MLINIYRIMLSDTDDEMDEVLLLWLLNRNKRARNSRMWTHPINKKRSIYGSYHHVFHELSNDNLRFCSYSRMSVDCFNMLVSKITPFVRQRQDTNARKYIRIEERLVVTLRYLATGLSFRQMTFDFRMGETTIGKIVEEMCDAIFKSLKSEYMPSPKEQDWLEIANKFHQLWNVPNTLGAIDGKHIRLRKPHGSGSSFFNYKGYHSLVLMACADAEGIFTSIDVGDYGRNSDGGVFKQSGLGKALYGGKLHLPPDCPLPMSETGQKFPYFFIADEAFQLSKRMMKPYPKRGLTSDKRIYNYRLSRGRRIIECAFGMMCSKWGVLNTAIRCVNVEKAVSIVCATCILHNYVRITDGKPMDKLVEFISKGGSSTSQLIGGMPEIGNRPANDALKIRDDICHYFMGVGSVPWQEQCALGVVSDEVELPQY